ncbi:restriction endonuclease subunit S [Lacticaseibacillus sharpeae]|uniref:restriction endonuclease subunit S n=1 Tax=Lacticaseibacillus sharpeae TaxID=1626 RepID=UPI0009EA0902|nr:restriction endonuclease subunit S [Lacticaseibacillus sharpeae]
MHDDDYSLHVSFAHAWEQRKLGEVLSERSQRSADGELLSVTMHDGIRKFSEIGKKDNSSQNKSNYKVVRKGDIAYNSMRMWQGASGVSAFNGIVSPAYTVATVGPLATADFIGYNFKRPSLIWTFQTHSQGLTSDTWNLKFPALSKISLALPSVAEQQQINNLFSTIGDAIALHQRKQNKKMPFS